MARSTFYVLLLVLALIAVPPVWLQAETLRAERTHFSAEDEGVWLPVRITARMETQS